MLSLLQILVKTLQGSQHFAPYQVSEILKSKDGNIQMAGIAPAPGYEGKGEFYFLKLMAEEIENEYIPGSTFRSESWLRVQNKFCKIYGPIFTLRCLKARLRSLKKRHQKFSELINEQGVSWNKKHNVIFGNQDVLKKYKLKSYSRPGFYIGEEHFDLMCQIFESGVKLD